jgi:hypothetical protein
MANLFSVYRDPNDRSSTPWRVRMNGEPWCKPFSTTPHVFPSLRQAQLKAQEEVILREAHVKQTAIVQEMHHG